MDTHSTLSSNTLGIMIPALRQEYEKRCMELVLTALASTHGDKSKAAKLLGVYRTTLIEYLKKHRPDLVNVPNDPRLSLRQN